jgi:hypothetical protein
VKNLSPDRATYIGNRAKGKCRNDVANEVMMMSCGARWSKGGAKVERGGAKVERSGAKGGARWSGVEQGGSAPRMWENMWGGMWWNIPACSARFHGTRRKMERKGKRKGKIENGGRRFKPWL